MSEEVKQEEEHELEEMKEGVVEAEKTATGFRVKGKWWTFPAIVLSMVAGAIALMYAADATGIIGIFMK